MSVMKHGHKTSSPGKEKIYVYYLEYCSHFILVEVCP